MQTMASFVHITENFRLKMLFILMIWAVYISAATIGTSERYRRFVNGRDAKRKEWKFHATLKYNNSAKVLWKICAGALIESRWILTAAHCVRNAESKNIKPDDFSVVLHEDENTLVKHAVKELFTPPNPDSELLRTMFDNDIALIELKKDAPEYMEKLQYINTTNKLFNCKAAGWGATKKMLKDDYMTGNYSLAEKLQEIDGSIVDFETFCPGFEPSKKICFAKINQREFSNGGCIGDSGSPVVCDSKEGKQLLGISIGGDIECKPNAVIATDVRCWIGWLAGIMRK